LWLKTWRWIVTRERKIRLLVKMAAMATDIRSPRLAVTAKLLQAPSAAVTMPKATTASDKTALITPVSNKTNAMKAAAPAPAAKAATTSATMKQ
tara:strand:- start:403 stop:684 length:282 start_codon:yes stop_codon:yes gene_type:complete